MDTQHLRERIARSKLLTSSEKQYWSAHAEELNEEQFAKLDRILREAEDVTWTPQIEAYIAMIQAGSPVTAA